MHKQPNQRNNFYWNITIDCFITISPRKQSAASYPLGGKNSGPLNVKHSAWQNVQTTRERGLQKELNKSKNAKTKLRQTLAGGLALAVPV